MFTPEEYYKAWLIYLGGVVLMMACWFYLTHFIPWREARQLLRVLVGVLLIVPWYSDAGADYMAPAVIIALVEALTHGIDAFWRAGTPLLISMILALVLSLSWHLWRWRRDAKIRQQSVTETP